MVRFVDLPPATQTGMRDLDCPSFERTPFVAGPPLAARRIAVVGSAGRTRRRLAATHYSFIGTTDPRGMEANAGAIAGLLQADRVAV